MLRPMIRGSGAGILKEFTEIVGDIDSTLVIADGHGLPSVLIRTFVYDSINRLDDFAREYRGHVGKVMDYVCMELRSLLYEVFEEGEDSGSE
ncbi:MAG: hypothetical protein LZ166_02245 [Thaumarchaeota archaeon]|jgi:hypothetical protein|nr:hypothetical protein [Candidatus Wolframiiraptor allenii]MCL7393795.1 hypothetical protein [Candidatus Wolframiiraptor allenii]